MSRRVDNVLARLGFVSAVNPDDPVDSGDNKIPQDSGNGDLLADQPSSSILAEIFDYALQPGEYRYQTNLEIRELATTTSYRTDTLYQMTRRPRADVPANLLADDSLVVNYDFGPIYKKRVKAFG